MLHQNKRSKKSKSDSWWTPLNVFKELCKEYNFDPNLDAAASEANSLCKYYFDAKLDSLQQDWIVNKKPSKVWLNPPNKLLGKFIQKAYIEYVTGRAEKIMMIVPLNVQSSHSWWLNVQTPLEKGYDIYVRPIRKRIAFMLNGKTNNTSSINGYCVVLFGFNKGVYLK